jgi:uncharacterized Fe-S cluster-containing radical SAM superfamily protein
LAYTPPEPVLHLVSRGEVDLLREMAADASRIERLARDDPGRAADLLERELLVDAATVLVDAIHPCIEIEINRHCNYRCVYCPVSSRPKPKGFMADDTYRLVLDRVKDYGATMVTLNHYSEPTLDPRLADRVETAVDYGLGVGLSTNGSLLSRPLIRRLAALGRVRVTVNLPSLDADSYRRLTGGGRLPRVLRNLEALYAKRVPTSLSINAPREGGRAALKAINGRFGEMFGEAVQWASDDRAGTLNNPDFADPVVHTGRLNGCAVVQGQLNVSWRGELFLCCQDFDQRYVFGDLHTAGIQQIKSGLAFKRAMGWIMGLETPPADFICTRCAWTESAQPLTFGARAKAPPKTVLADMLSTLPIRHRQVAL